MWLQKIIKAKSEAVIQWDKTPHSPAVIESVTTMESLPPAPLNLPRDTSIDSTVQYKESKALNN